MKYSKFLQIVEQVNNTPCQKCESRKKTETITHCYRCGKELPVEEGESNQMEGEARWEKKNVI